MLHIHNSIGLHVQPTDCGNVTSNSMQWWGLPNTVECGVSSSQAHHIHHSLFSLPADCPISTVLPVQVGRMSSGGGADADVHFGMADLDENGSLIIEPSADSHSCGAELDRLAALRSMSPVSPDLTSDWSRMLYIV